MELVKIFAFFVIVVSLSSCRFPQDPNHSLENILSSHLLKIGYCLNFNETFLSNREITLATKMAQQLKAKIIWIKDNQENLYRMLEQNKINLVLCTTSQSSPWEKRLAFSHPYYKNKEKSYVFSLPPGENAWLKYVNEFIHAQGE